MVDAPAMSGTAVTTMLAGFVRCLRDHDLRVGTGDLLTYTAAAAALDPTDLEDLYWAGRASLVTRRDQIPVYDRMFRHYYLHEPLPADDPVRMTLRARATSESVLEVPATDSGQDGGDPSEVELGHMASPAQVLRTKSFASCTPDELAALRRTIARLRVTPPRRRTRRLAPDRHGRRIDARRTARAALRAQLAAAGPDPLRRASRRRRVRPIVLILDVSGSMSDHSRNLLQFAHAAGRAQARVEVFCFGTRLTRLTADLRRRNPDAALARAAARAIDWDGGTQIGESLATFVRRWGRGGLARGAIVVIASDGLDRGDPAVLAQAMERLDRLAHRIVWLNPHARGGHPPPTLAMRVAEPHVDAVLPADDLAGLEALAHDLAMFA
jgi:uncharacterized protein with von Willebrand factor type A (vWA) domain